MPLRNISPDSRLLNSYHNLNFSFFSDLIFSNSLELLWVFFIFLYYLCKKSKRSYYKIWYWKSRY